MDPADVSRIDQEIRDTIATFAPLFNDGYRHHGLHHPEGIFMPHGLPTVYWAKKAKHEAGEKKFKTRYEALEMKVYDITVTSEDSAFIVTILHLLDKESDEVALYKSLTVMKKTPAGWKMFRDMYNVKAS